MRLTWDWEDGLPSPDVVIVSLVNPPNPDPFPSPTVQPRNLTNRQQHAFSQPCLYPVVFASRDDDGGSATGLMPVVITGTATTVNGAGYWQHQFAQIGKPFFNLHTLECFLAVAGHSSQVFQERRSMSLCA